MPAVGHNRERFLLRDELVSVPQGRILPLEESRRVRHAGETLAVVASCRHSETITHWRGCRACPVEVGTSEIWDLEHGVNTFDDVVLN